MPALSRPIISAVVSQHLEDLAALRVTRSVLLRSPHVELHRLARWDERLNAHLDGMLVAGDEGYRMALQELERPGLGSLFAVAVLAVMRGDTTQLHRLLGLADALPAAPHALASAMGWVSAEDLRGWTGPLLASSEPWHRWLGLAACTAHRVDPGVALVSALALEAPAVQRKCAARMIGQLGRVDLLQTLRSQLDDEDVGCRVAAAWSSVLLGDRAAALGRLYDAALDRQLPQHLEALQLYLLAVPPEVARNAVRALVTAGVPLRTTIRATAWAGDVQAVPWLVKHMADEAHARIAGESFSFITGAHLALLDLEVKGPLPAAGGGPTDDAGDDDVALDEDESLPWPDVAGVQAWWQKNAVAMPAGTRCFAGAVTTPAHCIQVLKTAGQRQRYAAALLMSLQAPGTPLFNIAAPSHRQQRWLESRS
jgi:uncharacterized protein (TIGR02270 family)